MSSPFWWLEDYDPYWGIESMLSSDYKISALINPKNDRRIKQNGNNDQQEAKVI